MFVVRQKGCIDAFVFVQVVKQKGCIAAVVFLKQKGLYCCFFLCVKQKGCIDTLCLFRYPQACPATWRQRCSGTGPPPTRPMPSPCWIPAGNPHSTFLTVGTFNSRPPTLLASSFGVFLSHELENNSNSICTCVCHHVHLQGEKDSSSTRVYVIYLLKMCIGLS